MGWQITAITVKRITIKRIISPVLIVFSLKTERIKVVILCLSWNDLPLKSSQLPLYFFQVLLIKYHVLIKYFLLHLCSAAFLFTIIYSPRRIIHSCAVDFRFGSCDLFCSICEKINDTHIFTGRSFKHLHMVTLISLPSVYMPVMIFEEAALSIWAPEEDMKKSHTCPVIHVQR